MAVTAEFSRHQQRAQAYVMLSSKRRDTQQVERRRRLQGEHTRALNGGSDDVVISKWGTIVAIRVGDGITDR